MVIYLLVVGMEMVKLEIITIKINIYQLKLLSMDQLNQFMLEVIMQLQLPTIIQCLYGETIDMDNYQQ